MRTKVLFPIVISLVSLMLAATMIPADGDDTAVSDDRLAALAQDPEFVRGLEFDQLMEACGGLRTRGQLEAAASLAATTWPVE